MASDPVFGSTLLSEGTAQGELLVNEWFGRLHAALIRVVSRGDTTPPGVPVNFDAYIVGTSATGDWSGQDGKIAVYIDGWKFITPKEGMRVRVMDTDVHIVHDGTNWIGCDGFQTLVDGASIDWDVSDGVAAQVTLGGNRTMNLPTKMAVGTILRLKVTQDGTGGRTITWNAGFKWPGGSAPTLTAAPGASDLLLFVVVTTSVLYGTLQAANLS